MKLMIKFTVFLNFFILLNYTCEARKARLDVTNNGPAVIGSNVTFLAVLSGYSPESELTYTFDDGVQKDTEIVTRSLNVSLSLPFTSDKYAAGQHCLKVNVKAPDFVIFQKTIASNYTCFHLQRSLVGNILVYQGNRNVSEDDDFGDVGEIAIGENFTVFVDLYDPNNFLKDAIIEYSWSFDMDSYFTSNNTFIYNFTDVGLKDIIVKVTATFPNSQSISGFFIKKLSAIVPVSQVNITGNPFFPHGDLLLLNVSCVGTPPFTYCNEILRENVTVENFTCHQISKFNTCHMTIRKYLPDGKHQLGIYVGNDVRVVKKIIEVMVYNVSIKPTLSTVIIPIVCSLLTLVIIAIGISFYIQQRNRLAVEVADFDFQDDSDSYAGERTFFEKIFDSFACRNCDRNRWSCINARTESDPLLDDDEPLPYV